MRAGNEKDEDTADTVGCCSLRVEHITLHDEKDGKEYVVDFDFLGKDSIRYNNSVAVEKRAYKNLKLFMENKQPGDDLFDRLNVSIALILIHILFLKKRFSPIISPYFLIKLCNFFNLLYWLQGKENTVKLLSLEGELRKVIPHKLLKTAFKIEK